MKQIVIKSREVNYSKISNPLQKNAFRIYRSNKVEDKRFKDSKYKNKFEY